MIEEKLVYSVDGKEYIGFLASLDRTKRPLILVAHAWMGQDDFARNQARMLAEKGYAALAVDNYGDGKATKDEKEAGGLMMALFTDRPQLRKRMNAALEAGKSLDWVDKEKVGAIGFCFGGLSVIELFRSGAPVKGVVSFHGILGEKHGGVTAEVPPTEKLKGSILVLHGAEDPLVTWDDIKNFTEEMTQAGADWEFDMYGKAVHAFTNPEAHNKEKGLCYEPKVAARAFAKMELFFKEIFG